MRAIFDFLKDALRRIDGYWIESAGHPVTVKGVFRPDPNAQKDAIYREDRGKVFEKCVPVTLYGFYDYPSSSQCSMFGIDAPDELEVQVNAEIVSEKLGRVLEIGTLLSIESSDWLVINRSWIYNRFIGRYRLELACQRYQESVTTGPIHMKTAKGNTIEVNNDI